MNCLRQLFRAKVREPQFRIVMVGLDDSGKTTMMCNLPGGVENIVTTIPTIGWNIETYEHKDTRFVSWDVGGCDKTRQIWKVYLEDISGLIFVVDSADRDRIVEAREEIQRIIRVVRENNKMPNVPLLVYANKQDLPGAMSVNELTDILRFPALDKREWIIKPASFKTRCGTNEGLRWLRDAFLRLQEESCSKELIQEKVLDSEKESLKSEV